MVMKDGGIVLHNRYVSYGQQHILIANFRYTIQYQPRNVWLVWQHWLSDEGWRDSVTEQVYPTGSSISG
jgi:hypothetical protein